MNQDICNLWRTWLRQIPLELCGVSSLCIAKQEVLGTETSNRGKSRGFCTTTSSASHRQQTSHSCALVPSLVAPLCFCWVTKGLGVSEAAFLFIGET